MEIHARFPGGNCAVERIAGDEVWLRNELRDTVEDWFYWAFCVSGAAGRTLTFHFDKPWLGYYGPAVSRDLENWRWLRGEAAPGAGDAFVYRFSEGEDCVYFAHDMLYRPPQFDALCRRLSLKPERLCVSEGGREVPCARFGEGGETILLTARHHACESTGSYVLEGALEELAREPIAGVKVVAVPFVDYDGVVQGDQGKSRAPYDHNRDYVPGQTARYASVRALREIASREKIRYALDFHSPWHLGGINDCAYIPQKRFDAVKQTARFANLLEREITPESLPYFAGDTLPPDTDWNRAGTPCFANYMRQSAGAELSFTMETPYFRARGCPFDAARGREFGRCIVRALRAYHARPAKISFTGDLLFQNPMNALCASGGGYDYLPLFKRAWARLADADYLVGNLESPVAGEAVGGYTCERYCFNTPEEALDAMKKAGFDLLTLANNHCMDRGEAGIAATLDACDRAGLAHIGLYRTREECGAPFVREIRGVRLGFVNATYGTNAFAHGRFLAEGSEYKIDLTQPEETREGSIHLLQPPEEIARQTEALYRPVSPAVAPYLEAIREKVARAKAASDYVVALLHSGGQYNAEPDAYTRMLAEKLWEFGADAVVCNHPHIILPSRFEGGRLTAFCLGNLISAPGASDASGPVDPDFSAVLSLTLEKTPEGVRQAFSFRIFRMEFDPEGKAAPHVTDTYDEWLRHPSEALRAQILKYANRFMPGGDYRQPMAEYPVR